MKEHWMVAVALALALIALTLVVYPNAQSSMKHYKIKPIPICKVTKSPNGTKVTTTYHETEGNVSNVKRTCA